VVGQSVVQALSSYSADTPASCVRL
jgi:hypothetical protein